jgi:glycosyltransferase involved in cell wall biosynthesis
MVFLNAERFMREAIESALAQTYDDWELLLIDDGSTDSGSAIASRYAERYPHRVVCLNHSGHSNRGISASQNLGINKARGEYIAFLDSDDVWLPHKLEQQIRLLDSQPAAGLLCGATLYWYGWTGRARDQARDLMIPPGFASGSVVNPPEFLVQFLTGAIPVPCPSDILVRRAIAEQVGGFEETFCRIFTDQAFYSKVCLASPVLVSTDCWFKYRRHADSSVSRARLGGRAKSERLNFLDWLRDYLEAREVRDPAVWEAVRLARFRALHPKLSRLLEHLRYRILVFRESARRLAHLLLPEPVEQRLRIQLRGRNGGGLKSQPERHV